MKPKRKPSPTTNEESPPASVTWVTGHFAKIVTAIAGGIAAITSIYGLIAAPATDLLQMLALVLVLVAGTIAGLASFLLTRKKRWKTDGVTHTTAYYTPEQRAAARGQLLLSAALIGGLAFAAFVGSRLLTPQLASVATSRADNEILVLSGARFGVSAADLRVKLGEFEQVPIRVEPNRIEVAVPENFRKGSISIRRGPRTSAALYFAFPGIVYDAAVIELISPTDDPTAAMMNLIEPFPGFPYYSLASDHPSQWPPRVFKDRAEFHAQIRQELSQPAVAAELDPWMAAHPSKVEVLGGGGDESIRRYLQLRLFLGEQEANYAQVRAAIGPATEKSLLALEARRRDVQDHLPNRMLMLRVQNQQNVDAENFTVQFKVGGGVYDVTLNAEGEKARSLEWSPQRLTVEIPRLRPNDTADVQIWYYRLPLEERVFPGAMDLEWEKTESVVIDNLGISNARVRRSPRLLADFVSYHRYAIDPVRGSPTFGRLPEPAAPVTAAMSPASDSPHATPPAHTPKPAAPVAMGPQAVLVSTHALTGYKQQNDALEAQVRVAQALADFSAALARAAHDANGCWVFERSVPVEARYNRFAGEFRLEGGTLALLYAERDLDVTHLAGWEELHRAGSVAVDLVPWSAAKNEVVLHFFSDPSGSKPDSKRLLTKALSLDQIFDLAKARAGERNAIAPDFADLLRFSRERLVKHYGAPFTLDKRDDTTAPFYLVVRCPNVSENFYLPTDWMHLAETPAPRTKSDAQLFGLLSRLYDYGDHSRELTAAEFAAIFAP